MCPQYPDISSVLEFVGKLLQVGGTWALVIAGWAVVSDQTQKREIAKNYLATFTKLRDTLGKIEEAASQHHMQGYDPYRVRKILRDLSNLGIEVTQLARRQLIGAAANQMVADFRIAVTKANFDSSTFQVQPFDSPLLLNIEAVKDQFDRVLLESMDIVTYRRISLWESVKGLARRG